MASALHDIGKIAIDDAILNKPGKYTPEEFAIMSVMTGEDIRTAFWMYRTEYRWS